MARLRRSSKPADRPPIPERFLARDPDWVEPYTVPPDATQAEAENLWVEALVAGRNRKREAAKAWALANGYTVEEMHHASWMAYKARQERALAESERS